MSIFKTKKANPGLEERLGETRATVDELERKIKQLQLEWDETYDKIRRLTSRLAKRDALDKRRAETNGGEPAPPAPTELDPISAKILSRRNRLYGSS